MSEVEERPAGIPKGWVVDVGKAKAVEAEKAADVVSSLAPPGGKESLQVAVPFTDGELEEVRRLPKTEKIKVMAELMFSDAAPCAAEVARMVKMPKETLCRWFREDTDDVRGAMKEAMSRRALLEMPNVFRRLLKLLGSSNEETCRKAALDLARAAKLPIDTPAQGGVGVQVIGQNVQLNTMSLGDLDKQIMEIAKRIGPEAQKLVEGELVTDGGKRKRGGGVSDSAGTATGSGSAAGNAQGAAKT